MARPSRRGFPWAKMHRPREAAGGGGWWLDPPSCTLGWWDSALRPAGVGSPLPALGACGSAGRWPGCLDDRGRGDPGCRKAAAVQGSGQPAAAWAGGFAPGSDEQRGLRIIYIGNFRLNCCWNPSPRKPEAVNVKGFWKSITRDASALGLPGKRGVHGEKRQLSSSHLASPRSCWTIPSRLPPQEPTPAGSRMAGLRQPELAEGSIKKGKKPLLWLPAAGCVPGWNQAECERESDRSSRSRSLQACPAAGATPLAMLL